MSGAESVTRAAHALLVPRRALAQEFSDAELSATFPPNGSIAPDDADYVRHAARRFADWRLEVDGLVERAASLSLAELPAPCRRAPRSRATIASKAGAPSANGRACRWHPARSRGRRARGALRRLSLRRHPRPGRASRYYESIDLVDAFHEQTILAYEMNGRPLPVAHGAPLRLRVERQLGYKMAKYVMRIEAVESLDHIEGGKGGYWEDRGYEWYAGI